MKRGKILTGLLCSLALFSAAGQADAAMTYEKALLYQEAHPEEIHCKNIKQKDIYGNKNLNRYFSFVGSQGLLHTGKSSMGTADRTLINFIISYGFPNIKSEPYAYIRWMADLAGAPDRGYEPKTLQIVFEDNFAKIFSLQGWEYRKQFVPGFFVSSWGHNYDGRIKLSNYDLYELSLHGRVVSASMDAGDGHIKHFFYSGDKDADKKLLFTKGIRHALKILEIDGDSIRADYEAQKAQAEKDRLAALRAEIENEIKADAEREAMKKAILEEMKQKEAAGK